MSDAKHPEGTSPYTLDSLLPNFTNAERNRVMDTLATLAVAEGIDMTMTRQGSRLVMVFNNPNDRAFFDRAIVSANSFGEEEPVQVVKFGAGIDRGDRRNWINAAKNALKAAWIPYRAQEHGDDVAFTFNTHEDRARFAQWQESGAFDHPIQPKPTADF